MSAVSIIAMKMPGAVLSRSGSMRSFGEPPPGIEMLSTPPADDAVGAIGADRSWRPWRSVCRPDEQKRFTDTPGGRLRQAGEQRAPGGRCSSAPCAQLPR